MLCCLKLIVMAFSTVDLLLISVVSEVYICNTFPIASLIMSVWKKMK